MAWDVEYTEQFRSWWERLTEIKQDAITAAVAILEEGGPGLGRPLVDTVQGSQCSTMKELRPPIRNIRILFAFDPRRTAILLLGGDKTNRWREWYREMIPTADQLYADHLHDLQGANRAATLTRAELRACHRLRSERGGGGMERKYRDLSAQAMADPLRRARIEQQKHAIRAALALAEIRAKRGITQMEVAEALEVSQANVSRIEHQQDVYLSTLAGYVRALGGRLEVSAIFPDMSIPVHCGPSADQQLAAEHAGGTQNIERPVTRG